MTVGGVKPQEAEALRSSILAYTPTQRLTST
jgi:hypothetical protein